MPVGFKPALKRHFPQIGVVFDFEQTIDVVNGTHVRGDGPAMPVRQQRVRENGACNDVGNNRMSALRDGHHDAGIGVRRVFAVDAAVAGCQDSITALDFCRLRFEPAGFHHDGVDQASIEQGGDFTVVGALRKNCLSKEVFGVFAELCDFCQTDAIRHERG